MIRFDREFHQSDFERFKLCPRMFYYRDVLKLQEERISELALAGKAIHEAVHKAHQENIWTGLFDFFLVRFQELAQETQQNGTDVTQKSGLNLMDYQAMLDGYAAKEWNREAEVLLSEVSFTFEITPSSTTYRFAGRIDQVVSIPKQLLIAEFPEVERVSTDYLVIHRDLKTGQRKGVGDFELLLNDQISIYAYAFCYGRFDLDGDGTPELPLHLLPDFHALYFLHDHVPYKRPPKGKDVRGRGMYLTERPAERLARIPRELMPTCASIRRGDFPREGVSRGICQSYCSVRTYCEADLLQEINGKET